MKKLLFAVALALSFSAQAAIIGFTGDYAPANWTQSPGTGSVNVFDATALSITSGNDGSGAPSATDVGIVIAQSEVTISFDWAYTTQDESPLFDPFGIKTLLFGDVVTLFTVLVDTAGSTAQSGSHSVILHAGDIFAFSQQTLDNLFGSATTRISNFRVDVTPVPEPSTLALLAVALAGGIAARRRKAV